MRSRTINSYLSCGNGKRPELSEMSVKRAFESPFKPRASSDQNSGIFSDFYLMICRLGLNLCEREDLKLVHQVI
jgi:hypothetical protein